MAARIVKVAKTLRNHWKKSTFAAVLAVYGVHFVQDRYSLMTLTHLGFGQGTLANAAASNKPASWMSAADKIQQSASAKGLSSSARANLLREEFCQKAVVYGQQSLKYATEKPRKVTVILNPAARKGKGKKLFDKNAAPLLHLAGIDVKVVKTESEGNAKEKARLLETTDAVVVAGGDGTVGEVITGLLRREDEASVSIRWPLGIIPTGATNSLARFLYANAESDVRWMGNAAMAVIRGVTEPVDVMAIQGEDGRKVFTVNNLEWGPLQEARERSTKYWYFGPLKWKATYVLASLKSVWPPVFKANIKHRPAFEEPEPMTEMTSAGINWWAWIQWLMFWRSSSKDESQESKNDAVDEESDHEETIQWTKDDIIVTELVVATSNTNEVKTSPRALRLTTGPADMSRTEFIKEGWRRTHSKQEEGNTEVQYKTQTVEVGEIRITPHLKEGEAWYTVDNERLEAQPITIHLLPRKLQFFSDRQDRDTLIGASQNT